MTHADELDLLASDTLSTLGEPVRVLVSAAPVAGRVGAGAGLSPQAVLAINAVITDRGEFAVGAGGGGGGGDGGIRGHAAQIVIAGSDLPDEARDPSGGVRQGSVVTVAARASMPARTYKVASSRPLLGGRQIAIQCVQIKSV